MVKKKATAALPAASAAAPPAAPQAAPSSPLPIAHYIPRLPLQLVAILFAIFGASSSVVKDDTIIGFPRVVAALTTAPLAVLPLACGLLAVVQTWFGYWIRSCRNEAIKAAKEGPKEENEKKAEPVKQKSGFRASFGKLWDNALKGEAPHQTTWKSVNRKKAAGGLGVDTRFVPQAVTTTLGATAVFHVCAVLLGAPLASNVTETFLLSFLLAILAILPISIAIPPFANMQERYVWLRLFSSLSPNDDLEFALLVPSLGALVGCWAGAIPIPLDWDRPWQKWPTTPILGALLGYAAGSVLSLVVTAYRGALRAAADVVRESKEQQQTADRAVGKKVAAAKGKKAQ
ncbi:hypothetical protein JCM6882_004673 [Rhodosporidiobolus microsporus]